MGKSDVHGDVVVCVVYFENTPLVHVSHMADYIKVIALHAVSGVNTYYFTQQRTFFFLRCGDALTGIAQMFCFTFAGIRVILWSVHQLWVVY